MTRITGDLGVAGLNGGRSEKGDRHTFRSIRKCGNLSHQVTLGFGDLARICEISWSWDVACIDGVPDDGIQPILRRGSAETPRIVQYAAFGIP